MTDTQSAAQRRALHAAKLIHANDASRGITRKRRGKSFEYFSPTGKRLTKPAEIDRINKLAIPPAYEDVWICPSPRGHIQATGKDARGRKQYRYHPAWRETRDASKYEHTIDFAKALPKIRRETAKHLRMKGLPRQKVLAAVVRVMEKTLIRVGNAEYAKSNHSYGLTTMLDKHAKFHGRGKMTFEFRGKSGVAHEIDLNDARLAKIVEQCRDLPGQELFAYQDEAGKAHDIGSQDVNDYLREITGKEFTAKDFRTWAGTVLAATTLHAFADAADGKVDGKIKGGQAKAVAGLKKNLLRAIETVAERLGNTKAVCRKCYIHPAVMTAYLDGDLADRLKSRASAELEIAKAYGLDEDEEAVLRMLERKL